MQKDLSLNSFSRGACGGDAGQGEMREDSYKQTWTAASPRRSA